MRPRVVVAIFMFFTIYSILSAYIGWHGWLFFSVVYGLPSSLFWAIYIFIAFAFIAAKVGKKFFPVSLLIVLKWVGAYWIAVFQYALLLLPLADVAAFILNASHLSEITIILWLGWIVLIVLFSIMALGSWNAWTPHVRKMNVTVAKQAGTLSTLRIAFASDLHLGDIVGIRHVQRLIDHIRSIQPDLIVLPGDIIDDDIEPFIRKNLAQLLKQLNAPYGVYAVTGNHEYIGGELEQFQEQMRQSGITLLLDESILVKNSFYVIGRKDRSVESFRREPRLSLDELLLDIDRSLPLILLDHQPHRLGEAAGAGIDVMLSGHTHRGQMTPNHWITRKIFELDYGYKLLQQMHVVVSSGYGTWGPPIRIGSRSEIVELELSFDKRTDI